jgi:hypothetical protein
MTIAAANESADLITISDSIVSVMDWVGAK